jgi:hypothetical protein
VTGFVLDVFVRTGILTSRSPHTVRHGSVKTAATPSFWALVRGRRAGCSKRRTLIIMDMSLRKGAVFAQAFSMRSFTRCLTRDGWPRVGRFQTTSLIAGRVGIARRRTRVDENSELFFRLSATNHGL